MRVLCSSRKTMRKTPVSGFPRALLSLSHARKRRALASRLSVGLTVLDILDELHYVAHAPTSFNLMHSQVNKRHEVSSNPSR